MDPPPMPSAGEPARSQGCWQAAKDFEAMAIGQLLAPMFDTVDTCARSTRSAAAMPRRPSGWRPMLVESRRGAVPPFATRFPSPLIKPDVRISRIRLSDWLHEGSRHGARMLAGGTQSRHAQLAEHRSIS
jgi:hypothetical protein